MVTPEHVISPRQLYRLSTLLLGLWLFAIVLASFQPCLVAAETLSKTTDLANVSGTPERDSLCQRADTSHDKSVCCDEVQYTYCNLPDIAKHDDALSVSANAHPVLLRSIAFLLPLDEGAALAGRVASYDPPSASTTILLSVTRLLI